MNSDKCEDHGPERAAEAAARPCPICGKPFVFAMRPFCSKRCADIDLHRWLGGVYAIPVAPEDEPNADPGGAGED
jgi:endogenous inhibitor of DNA gyrase (YacG/DUF329 family)